MRNTETMSFLLVIETQKVKSYLFASPIMRETRGASLLLDLLNRKEIRKILGKPDERNYKVIYLGGGTGKILFRVEKEAKIFKNKILDLYRQKTINARVSVEIVPRNEDENFAKWIRSGVRKSQQNKLGHVEGISLIGGRWIRPCTSCGGEPAEKMHSEHGERRLCRACLLKRNEINNLYAKIKPTKKGYRVLKHSSALAVRYTDDFIFTTLAKKNEDANFRVLLTQDFNDIGKCSNPLNYIGVIYADGNRMGEVIKTLGEMFPEDKDAQLAYKAFSEIVDIATREAAVEAVLEIVAMKEIETEEGIARFIPAEFVMAGGDDLMLVVPAHNALDVAVLFMEKFQEKTQKIQVAYVKQGKLPQPFAGCGLTTSAGVVIAHAHYPISDLMTMAEDLMKLAKKRSAELAFKLKSGDEDGQETGTLDFMVLSEAGSEPVKERRKNEYTQSSQITRTERPYTAADARRLLTTIRSLKRSKLPRSKLKALYPVLFKSFMQAQFDALRIKERLKTTGDLKEGSILHRVVTSLSCFPFREKSDNEWTTPLTEIIELYDFIQPKNRVVAQ
ncbi:MAG: type III-B CRISPR-associated protein Cas10/Cmr2 [Desulfobacteraceae bacterium]|nr:type III-B CRISPR-associated protein Cas10/Cmr2 [Desulfobacteraceae bacterium]MBC2719237.1 type III-B CRISPR-associated protein Cas10/Cmr2 [Desulfobacteraceae bacterium]